MPGSARRSTRTIRTGRSRGSRPARRGCRWCRWPRRAPSSSYGGRTAGRRSVRSTGGSVNGDARDQVVYEEGDDRSPFPDIEGDRAAYEILSWDMEPGDVVVFNGRMVHGGSGNLAPDRDLKVFNTQWLGDDVRVLFRPEGMSPDHSAAMTEVGLSSGDRIGTDLYPQLWRREPIPA